MKKPPKKGEWIKTPWGQHLYNTADLIDLALSVLSSASSLIQTDDLHDMHVVKGKLNTAADNVKHMQGQVAFRLGEDIECPECGSTMPSAEGEVCLDCQVPA